MSEHAQDCNCLDCRFGIEQQEGSDETSQSHSNDSTKSEERQFDAAPPTPATRGKEQEQAQPSPRYWIERATGAEADREQLDKDVEELEAERDTEKEIAWREIAKNTDLNNELQEVKAERDRLATENKNLTEELAKQLSHGVLNGEKLVRLTESHRELLEACRAAIELEKHTHRIPESVNSTWVAGIIDDIKAAIAKAEEVINARSTDQR